MGAEAEVRNVSLTDAEIGRLIDIIECHIHVVGVPVEGDESLLEKLVGASTEVEVAPIIYAGPPLTDAQKAERWSPSIILHLPE